MKCKNYFFSFFVALLGVFFGSCIINQNNTYATSVSYTFNGSSDYSSESFYCKYSILVFSYNPPSGCSNLLSFIPAYVSISTVSTSLTSSLGSNSFGVFSYSEQPGNSVWANVSLYVPYVSSAVSLTLPTIANNSAYIIPVGNYQSSWEVTFTFYDSLPTVITPSGSIELTENGIYDVSQYAEAVVNVPETDCPPSSGGGNYHEDLVAINNSILICAAVCLVIYFFYCIYRMIIKNSGVK